MVSSCRPMRADVRDRRGMSCCALFVIARRSLRMRLHLFHLPSLFAVCSLLLVAGWSPAWCCNAFRLAAVQPRRRSLRVNDQLTEASRVIVTAARHSENNENIIHDRRKALSEMLLLAVLPTSTAAILVGSTLCPATAADLETPSFVQEYADFIKTPEGWSYREVTPGKPGGVRAAMGDRVVFDWSGYTIGYFGRPFQAKGGPQGGAFDKDVDYLRTVLGSGQMVKGLECSFVGMSAGQVRQVVVPYKGDLSYPPDDSSHERVGPKPTTFSGMRALNFVLDNPRLDRTMLFNVKVIRVDKPDGKGGFSRG